MSVMYYYWHKVYYIQVKFVSNLQLAINKLSLHFESLRSFRMKPWTKILIHFNVNASYINGTAVSRSIDTFYASGMVTCSSGSGEECTQTNTDGSRQEYTYTRLGQDIKTALRLDKDSRGHASDGADARTIRHICMHTYVRTYTHTYMHGTRVRTRSTWTCTMSSAIYLRTHRPYMHRHVRTYTTHTHKNAYTVTYMF